MKIIVCTDGSEYGDKTVEFAARFAEKFRIDLTILHVIEDLVPQAELPTYPGFRPKKEEAEAILSHAEKLITDISREIKCNKKIACGPISSEIVRIAEVEGFDGIIIGTRGLRGLKRMLLGSVAEDVMRHAHCPVTLVR
ncbi:MAG: universal stress protein [Thermodesulfobacteriota bacterium]|nr:universal stress protein [Thermodesulfobacteriota bacterium]